MHYEIDNENFTVRVYDEINAEPFLLQPHYPNGDSFDSYEEAENWAKETIKSFDPDYGFYAPNGKDLPGLAKPTPEEIIAMKLNAFGLTVDELKSVILGNS